MGNCCIVKYGSFFVCWGRTAEPAAASSSGHVCSATETDAWASSSKRIKGQYTGNQSHSQCFLMKTLLKAPSDAALESSICSCILTFYVLRTTKPALYVSVAEQAWPEDEAAAGSAWF